MTVYKKGMFVDIVGNGSIHKGMPHKFYHGRTGRIFDISPNSVGVIINKQVRNRIVQKRIHVRVEHLKISTCNDNFKKHVREVKKAENNRIYIELTGNGFLYNMVRIIAGTLLEVGLRKNTTSRNPQYY